MYNSRQYNSIDSCMFADRSNILVSVVFIFFRNILLLYPDLLGPEFLLMGFQIQLVLIVFVLGDKELQFFLSLLEVGFFHTFYKVVMKRKLIVE